jgi:erythromycin esterase-like protein
MTTVPSPHADPGPDAKIVLWAHNMHVSKQVLPAKGSPSSPYPWTPMGHYLHERFGHQVFSVGFTFGHGTFTAITMRDHEPVGLEPQDAGQPPVDSYEHYLASAGIPRMLLDLRSIRSSRPSRPGSPGPSPTSPETDWLIGPRLLRSIGPVYDSSVPEHWFEEVRLAEAFDLLIYFQEAKASGVLPP